MFLRVGSLLVLLQMSHTFENLPTYITGLTLLVQMMNCFLVLRYVICVIKIFAANITVVRLFCVFQSPVDLQFLTLFEFLGAFITGE